jgi:hypothetical protein
MDFDERDFDEMSEANNQQQPQSPVEVILGIREELAEFQRNGGREALLAKLRENRKADLLATLQGPDPFGLDFVIEHLRDRGLIPPAPPRWLGKATAGPRRRRRQRKRDALGPTGYPKAGLT